MNEEKAKYIAVKASNIMSKIFKQLCELQTVLTSEQYQALFKSDDKEIKEIIQNANLPRDLLEYIEDLLDSF
jgi:vacuolar-type H+-ATPase subunit E/Vma4